MTPFIYRIDHARELPPAGPVNAAARERQDLEFKTFADASKSWEHSKDIAALANALGGVILIGADDRTGERAYSGLAGQPVAVVKKIYEDAAKMCSPTVIVDVVPIQHTGVTVVAVNVEPYIEQPVAAPAGTRDQNGQPCKHGEAWVFPIRRASQTELIEPENLAMYMNREIRRAVLLLARIPNEARKDVTVHHHVPRPITGGALVVDVLQLKQLHIEDVSVELNRLRLAQHGSGTLTVNVPLLDVLDVWESTDGRWDVRVAGEVRREKGQSHDSLHYNPMPRS